jgi:outer membrane protein
VENIALILIAFNKVFILFQKWIFFLLSISIFFLLPSNGLGQNSITLSQAINSGLVNKNNILAGKQDVAISKLQTKALYRKYLPQVSAEYTYLYNPILQTSILPIGLFNPNYQVDATKSVQFGTKWTQSVGLTAMLPLFDLSIPRQIEEAKLQERISALAQDQSEYELAYTIAQKYIEIYTHEAKVKSLIADTFRTYISYALLKSKYDENRLLKSDLNKSKINHNNTLQFLADGISQLIQDKVYLLFLMGTREVEKFDFQIDSNFSMKYTISTIISPVDLIKLPELQKLSLQSLLTNLQAKSEMAKGIPNIGLKGFLGANQFSNTFSPIAANTWFGTSYVGLDIKIPILFGENLKNKIHQLKLESNQYILQQEDKNLQYTNDIFTSKIKMENLQFQLKTQAENIELTTESIGLFQARFKEGQESAFNLNLEEANLQVQKTEYESSNKQLWIYFLSYLKDSGHLTFFYK